MCSISWPRLCSFTGAMPRLTSCYIIPWPDSAPRGIPSQWNKDGTSAQLGADHQDKLRGFVCCWGPHTSLGLHLVQCHRVAWGSSPQYSVSCVSRTALTATPRRLDPQPLRLKPAVLAQRQNQLWSVCAGPSCPYPTTKPSFVSMLLYASIHCCCPTNKDSWSRTAAEVSFRWSSRQSVC